MTDTQIYNDVSKMITRLTFVDPMMGTFISTLDLKLVKDDSIPLAAVSINQNKLDFDLHIRVDEWVKLTPEIKQGVLLHEVLHLVFLHLTDLGIIYKQNPTLANIASDCEINQYIPKEMLPNWGVFIEDLRIKYPEANLPDKYGSVHYFNELKKCFKNDFELHPFAKHGWKFDDENDDLPEDVKEILNNKINGRLQEIREGLREQGNYSQKYDSLIKDFVKPKPVFNYKKYIRTFINNGTEYEVKKSYYKLNPKFPDSPKVVLRPKGKTLILFDQSGSVGTIDEALIANEIYHLAKTESLEIRSFDTEISDIIKFKKGDKVFLRNACGGTSFKVCVDYFNSRPDITTCIVFTDGKAETPPPCFKNILWVVTTDGTTQTLTNLKGNQSVLHMKNGK